MGTEPVGAVHEGRCFTDHAPCLGASPPMRAVVAIVERIAGTNTPILIGGERGVGKDVVARAIHAMSARRHGPFVKVNCAAIPLDLLEAEVFGHEKGAFPGAHRRKPGRFEYADRGTVYLDELAVLPLRLQAKLLLALHDRRFSRVGSADAIDVDARVIAATNRNPEEMVAAFGPPGRDLYERLNVVGIHVPPLRQRREEIRLLASWFLDRFNEQYGRQKRLSPETLACLAEHAWPGNVRELETVIRRMVVLPHGERDFVAIPR